MATDTERGTPGGIIEDGDGGFHVDPLDPNPDLHFPLSVAVYDQMRRTDTGVSSLLRSISQPILSAGWDFAADGVRPEVLEACRAEFGITAPRGSRQRRRKHGIVWKEHLKEVLLMLPYGFMPFHQVYEPGPPIPGQEGSGLTKLMHVRKLAPRLPRTLTEINLARDGGLKGVTQTPLVGDKDVFIPVEELVYYVLDKEGADWTGNSILRTAYKDWLIKDKLIRVGAQTVERNGMGVPVITYESGNAEAKAAAEDNVKRFRAGANAGLALPSGTDARLMGVTGTTTDALPWIEKLDRNIAESGLAMFKTLGHDNGARSLGETFYDIFTASLQAVADLIAETATEHIIRDFVELNFGEDEPYPVLTPGDLAANKGITTEALKNLVDSGVVKTDDTLEAHVRQHHNLPEAEVKGGMGSAELAQRGNYLGTLIRSGYDPKEAMEQAGLDPIKHLGLLPVTLQPPAKGTDLENAVDPVEPPAARLSAGSGHLDKATALLRQVAELEKQKHV